MGSGSGDMMSTMSGMGGIDLSFAVSLSPHNNGELSENDGDLLVNFNQFNNLLLEDNEDDDLDKGSNNNSSQQQQQAQQQNQQQQQLLYGFSHDGTSAAAMSGGHSPHNNNNSNNNNNNGFGHVTYNNNHNHNNELFHPNRPLDDYNNTNNNTNANNAANNNTNNDWSRLQFPPDSHFAQSGLSPNAPTFSPGLGPSLAGMLGPGNQHNTIQIQQNTSTL